jgi:rhamnulokinase
MQEFARVAIDLGAESCRVSLVRWKGGVATIDVVHRIPNGPVHRGLSMVWPLDSILVGIEQGLCKAALAAPEGIASIAVDGWGVDYVRLGPDGKPFLEPFCYRDERTTAAKKAADRVVAPLDLYRRTGALPLRINTVYQLLADTAAGIDPHAPWITLPEYVLHWLGGRRVAEYTHGTHTGLVNLKTGDWDHELFRTLGLSLQAAPPIVPPGTFLGPLKGPLAALDALRDTQLIAPACHDTASAVAGIPRSLSATAYIGSGTWSLVGTLSTAPVTTKAALDARFTNLGSATGDLCFHTQVNGMWLLRQCIETWKSEGRVWDIEDIVARAGFCGFPGTINVDAEPLLLDSDMPERINHQLWRRRWATIPDVDGNEPVFARVIFESLAARYAAAISGMEQMLGHKIERIHFMGGASRNKLLTELTAQRTGLPVEIGHPESSTIGNLAVQLAASDAQGQPLSAESVRKWAQLLCES